MRLHYFSCLLAVAIAADARAQFCHAENNTPNFNDNVSMGGPLVAIQFTAPTNLAVTAMEVFTGEGLGTSTLGIWSHNAILNEPLANLGTGAWHINAANSWQGASLPVAINLSVGTLYWAVWGPVGGCQAAVDVPMTFLGQVYRGSFDGGATWNGPFQFTDRHWKFRLVCDSCPGFFLQYGPGCPGLTGVPILSGGGCPTPGDAIQINVANGLAGASGLILIGGGTLSGAVSPGCMLSNLPLFPPTVPFNLSAAGTLTVGAVLPPMPTPVDAYLQVILADPANPFGIAATNALQMHVN